MSAVDPISAAVGLNAAGTLGRAQLAVAGRMRKIASQQGDAALKLIEAAAENMSAATSDLNQALGSMLDLHA